MSNHKYDSASEKCACRSFSFKKKILDIVFGNETWQSSTKNCCAMKLERTHHVLCHLAVLEIFASLPVGILPFFVCTSILRLQYISPGQSSYTPAFCECRAQSSSADVAMCNVCPATYKGKKNLKSILSYETSLVKAHSSNKDKVCVCPFNAMSVKALKELECVTSINVAKD